MLSITKQFGSYPFAHRQPNHKGHCRLIHGHGWRFDITFTAASLDPNGFILDFGGMLGLKKLLESYFDHTLVLNELDPNLKDLVECLHLTGLAKIVTVPNCGAEGLARFVASLVSRWLSEDADYAARSVMVTSVVVFEDEKNSATYTP